MDFLETLFYDLMEEKEPDTPEYRENRMVRDLLMGDIQKAMGPEMVNKISAIYADWVVMECQRYFRYGVQLGIELLCL